MQTLQFTRSLKEIVARLRVNEFLQLLEPWLPLNPAANAAIDETQKDLFSELTYRSRAGYDMLSESENYSQIMRCLNIDELFERKRLRRMTLTLSGFSQIAQLRGTADFPFFFEKLRSLRDLQIACADLLEDSKTQVTEPSDSIFQLEIVDYDGMGIEARTNERFAHIVRELHTHISKILGVDGGQLRFSFLILDPM